MPNPKYRDEEWLREEIEQKNSSYKDIAEECDTSDSIIRRWRDKYGITPPLKDPERLQEMLNSGMTAKDIAERFNEELYQVRIRLEQEDLIQPYNEL